MDANFVKQNQMQQMIHGYEITIVKKPHFDSEHVSKLEIPVPSLNDQELEVNLL